MLIENLEEWGLSALQFPACLVLSELVANAVLHARTEIRLALQRTDSGVRIEVGDRSPRIPQPRNYAVDATTGRGLALVHALSEAWGVEPTDDGKIVWCEVSEASAARGEDEADADFDGFPDLDQFPDLDEAPMPDQGGPESPPRRAQLSRNPRQPGAPGAAA